MATQKFDTTTSPQVEALGGGAHMPDVALYGKFTNPGDTPLVVDAHGYLKAILLDINNNLVLTTVAVGDGQADAQVSHTGARLMVYNGATWDKSRNAKVFKTFSAVTITSETTVWTPAAGKKFRLMGGVLKPSVTADITLRDNTAGTTIAVIPSTTIAVWFDFENGILSAAANNVLTAQLGSAGSFSGMLYGTEE